MNALRLVLVLLCGPLAALIPGAGPVPLKPVNGALKESIGSVPTIRELRDGRLLIQSGGSLFTGDFTSGSIQPVAKVPGGKLVRLPGDSTLIVAGSAGWIVLDGEKALGMLPPTNPVVTAANGVFGADSTGHLLTATGGQPSSDSATVWRIVRSTGARDSVTRLWQGPPAMGGIPAPVYVVNEQAVLAVDGWIAVLRAHPYRVDWLSPQGQWILGKSLPIPEIRMDEREKDAYMVQRALPAGHGPESPSIISNWPSIVEPFTTTAPLLPPTGELLVPRTRSADATDSRYDVVDRQGSLVRQLELPANERIIGFGRQSVYVRVSIGPGGGNGRIERHPWP